MVVALPSSTFDWALTDGVKQVPIEKRTDCNVLPVCVGVCDACVICVFWCVMNGWVVVVAEGVRGCVGVNVSCTIFPSAHIHTT